MWIWSNPTPSNVTAAALGNDAQIQPTHIGEIMREIMQFRQAEAENKREDIQNLAKGISGAFGAYEQKQQQAQADAAANAAIYRSQYPNDVYGGFTDPNRVPDDGGTNALRALEAARIRAEMDDKKAHDGA